MIHRPVSPSPQTGGNFQGPTEQEALSLLGASIFFAFFIPLFGFLLGLLLLATGRIWFGVVSVGLSLLTPLTAVLSAW